MQTPLIKSYLRHFHYDIFEPLMVDPLEGIDTASAGSRIQFHMNVDGNIYSVTAPFEATLKPIEFVRKAKELPITAGKMKMYEGEYELSGLVGKVYTKGDVLFLFVAGQPEYELASTGEHKFNIRTLDGFSVEFHLDDKKQVTAMSFIQPNGTFRATRKQ